MVIDNEGGRGDDVRFLGIQPVEMESEVVPRHGSVMS